MISLNSNGLDQTAHVLQIAPDKALLANSTDIFFLSFHENMLWVLIGSASPRRGTSNEYPQHMFFVKK